VSVVPTNLRFPRAAAAASRPLVARGRNRLAVARDQWWPRLAFGIDRIGIAGMVGIALLAGTAVLQFSTRAPLAAETSRLREELAALPAAAPERARRAEVAHGVTRLPARAELPQVLKGIVAEAEKAGVALPSGKYETAVTRAGGIVRYQVTLPVNGQYRQVRAFIAAVLDDVPNAALSGLALQRRAIGDAAVDANVRITLFLRDGP
jgi:hypothetical protein